MRQGDGRENRLFYIYRLVTSPTRQDNTSQLIASLYSFIDKYTHSGLSRTHILFPTSHLILWLHIASSIDFIFLGIKEHITRLNLSDCVLAWTPTTRNGSLIAIDGPELHNWQSSFCLAWAGSSSTRCVSYDIIYVTQAACLDGCDKWLQRGTRVQAGKTTNSLTHFIYIWVLSRLLCRKAMIGEQSCRTGEIHSEQ